MTDEDIPEGDGPEPMTKGGRMFTLAIDLENDLFSGEFKDRDKEIANILRVVFTRMVTGNYTPDHPNALAASMSDNKILAVFEFTEGT